MKRRLVFIGIVALLLVATAAGAAYHCTVLALPIPAGVSVHPTALNVAGKATGYLTGPSGDRAFFWSSGTGMVVLTPDRAYGIDEIRTCVGFENFGVDVPPFNIPYACQWTSFGQQWISSGKAIARGKASSLIVGEEQVFEGGAWVPKPVLWETGRKTIIYSATPGEGRAYGVNKFRCVVGAFKDHAFFWKLGVATDLGLGEAFSINNNNQVVGYAVVNGVERPAAWKSGVRRLLGLPGLNGRALGQNDSTLVAGYMVGTSGTKRAALWANGYYMDLNDLSAASLPPGWFLTAAVGVNNSGQILCEGRNGLGQTGAFLLKLLI